MPTNQARSARASVGLSDSAGLLVREVESAGPAAEAALQPGDLLVGLDDDATPLLSCLDLPAAARGCTP